MLSKLGMEENLLNLINNICKKSHVLLWNLNTLHPETGKRQKCATSAILISVVWEVPASVIRQEKEIKGYQLKRKKQNSFPNKI